VNKKRRAAAKFFVRIGAVQRRRVNQHDTITRPLFPIWLILDADGTLAKDARAGVMR